MALCSDFYHRAHVRDEKPEAQKKQGDLLKAPDLGGKSHHVKGR